MTVDDIAPARDGCATDREIAGQPAVWRDYAAEIARRSGEIRAWVALRQPREIWLCGAGTSAYVGEAACAYLEMRTGLRHRAVPTTSLVSSPGDFIGGERRVLVVSLGRSGDSSETIGALDILDRWMPEADRLNITCNSQGALARRACRGPGEQHTLVLPARAHDQGFAMTASFTTMLLSALACLDNASPALVRATVKTLAAKAAHLLPAAGLLCDQRLSRPPARAVFLGSGPLTAIAREAGLKVLELTQGRVATAWESSLGFRHGPKAIIDADTLVFVNVAIDPHARRYDLDLLAELRREFGAARVVAIGPADAGVDLAIEPVGNDAWSAALYVLLPQLLAARWGQALGVRVDNPYEGGQLTRVVAGVTLYSFEGGGDVRRH